MSMRTLLACFAATTIVFTFPAARKVGAQNAPIRVLASNGVKGAVEQLKAQAERETGHPLDIRFSSTAALKKEIESGAAFDVTVITTEAVADLTKKGKIAAGSSAPVGRSELGIGIKSGVPKPDLKSTSALRKALREAKSITYPQDGATRAFIEQMFDRLGIAAEVKPRIVLAPSSGAATESVAEGKATFVITLFSEILPTHGVEILGALPGEFANDVKFTAAASPQAKEPASAKALIAFLTGPKSAAVFKAKGVER